MLTSDLCCSTISWLLNSSMCVYINFDDNIGFVKCQNLWSETLEIYETSELCENNESTETQWYNAKQFGWQRALIFHIYEVVISCHLMLDWWQNDGAVTQRQLPIIFAPTAQVPARPRWVQTCKTSFASSDSVCHAWGWYLFAHLTDTRIALSVLSTTAVHSYTLICSAVFCVISF